MKTCFFTLVSSNYYYPVGTLKMINSFRRFHPDIDLVIYTDDVINPIFKEKKIDFYNAKPTFAKLLTDKYDLVVNIDADTVICDRLSVILKGDYEVGAVWNQNQYENASFENVTSEMYLQAGLVAATKKSFWDDWERVNYRARNYKRRENDVMNKVIYADGDKPLYDLKIFDKDYGYMGCKSLGQEEKMYMEGDKLMLNKEQVFAYHHARGGYLPKLEYDKLGFTWDVQRFLEMVSQPDTSIKITNV